MRGRVGEHRGFLILILELPTGLPVQPQAERSLDVVDNSGGKAWGHD
jgi:hypothetical protein